MDADGRRTTQIRKEKEKKNYARVVRNGATAMATDGRSRQSRVVRITVPKADETDDVPFGHSDGRRTDGIEDDDRANKGTCNSSAVRSCVANTSGQRTDGRTNGR